MTILKINSESKTKDQSKVKNANQKKNRNYDNKKLSHLRLYLSSCSPVRKWVMSKNWWAQSWGSIKLIELNFFYRIVRRLGYYGISEKWISDESLLTINLLLKDFFELDNSKPRWADNLLPTTLYETRHEIGETSIYFSKNHGNSVKF